MSRFLMLLMVLALAGCSGEAIDVGDESTQDAASAAPPGQAVPKGLESPAPRRRASILAEASMPDRGELVSYPSPQEDHADGAYRWSRIGISEDHAIRAVAEGVLRVTAPSGKVLHILYDDHHESPSGDWTWVGHLAGASGVQTILTFGAEAVFGSIGQEQGRALRITMRAGQPWMVETDPRRLASSAGADRRRSDYLRVPAAITSHSAASSRASSAQVARLGSSAAAVSGATTIDLAIGYTQGFVTEVGGTSAAGTRLTYLVAVANQAFENSQTNVRLRVVRVLQVNYPDTTSNETALEQMTGFDSDSQGSISPDPAFDALRAARDQSGADVVTLVRGFRAPEQEGCGIAWLLGGGRSGIVDGDGQESFAYSVVGDGVDRNEEDGSDYFCRDETMAHEVAHNMGSQHDRETAQGDNSTLDNDEYGVSTYSFGLKTGSGTGNFYTVMAYGDDGQTEYRVFSNPRITLCGGRACGTTQYEDNARSLGQTAPVVAGFRARVVPLPSASLARDFNGDNRSDVLWRNGTTGQNSLWRSGSSSSYQPVTTVGTAWGVAGTGDFNGDGRSDILWRNNGTGQNSIWRSANSASYQPVNSVGSAWRVAGIGDFNGDGRSDILWHNDGTGQNSIWQSANAASYQPVSTVGTAWSVAGVGDFDGDGRSDILWRNAGNGQNAIWRSGNSASYRAVTATGTPWRVDGVGDFDGDGRSDILWRNRSTGQNSIWRSGSSDSYQAMATVATNWWIATTGDFDGDGRYDVIWRSRTSGQNVIWKSANKSTPQSMSSVTSQAWQVAD
jgi:hypothetical protein